MWCVKLISFPWFSSLPLPWSSWELLLSTSAYRPQALLNSVVVTFSILNIVGHSLLREVPPSLTPKRPHPPGSPPTLLVAPSLSPSLIFSLFPDYLMLEGPGLCSSHLCLQPLNDLSVSHRISILFMRWPASKLISLVRCFLPNSIPRYPSIYRTYPLGSGEHLQPKDQKKIHEPPSSYSSPNLHHLSTWAPHSSSVQAPNLGLILNSSPIHRTLTWMSKSCWLYLQNIPRIWPLSPPPVLFFWSEPHLLPSAIL